MCENIFGWIIVVIFPIAGAVYLHYLGSTDEGDGW